MEIGPAAGYNFHLYPDKTNLTILEYNENFKKSFLKNIEHHPNIKLISYNIGRMEDMSMSEDNCYDYFLTSHVLCSVKDVKKSLEEVYRVLKKVYLYDFI